jgi:hypothetical protein
MMVRHRRFAWLVDAATVLVAWHAILLSVPHTHGAKDIPRYATVCAAAVAGSTAVHLHPSSVLIPPHACLACLVASANGATVTHHHGVEAPRRAVVRSRRIMGRRSDIHLHLPPLRAPPSAV